MTARVGGRRVVVGTRALLTAEGVDASRFDGAAAEVIAPDVYPDFPMGQFNDKERAQVVKLTKAELCPCEESTESLHQCLQSKAKRCALAEQSLNMVGGMVKAAYSETDILTYRESEE